MGLTIVFVLQPPLFVFQLLTFAVQLALTFVQLTVSILKLPAPVIILAALIVRTLPSPIVTPVVASVIILRIRVINSAGD
ncbi:hypothetical protein EH105704_02_00260 [Atlantibacter hermannii NBRC 105704]|uniref:Uncharacterized protein n=1 Tax=Atlantibacter hermannii NBRC 105704 TaxID=1115512 RepID=H5UZ39_ATLHE|nr:hypothetical protein EH105704_02_00260 [Atlantibacter hermannii NBRC 105704]